MRSQYRALICTKVHRAVKITKIAIQSEGCSLFAEAKAQNYGFTPREKPKILTGIGCGLWKLLSAYKSSNISETRQDRAEVTIEDNRKSHTRFRMVPKSTTLYEVRLRQGVVMYSLCSEKDSHSH